MHEYAIEGRTIDAVELKCLVVSRGVRVGMDVYRALERRVRLSVSPLCCNCFVLPDGTIVQMTDMSFHLRYLGGALSWDNLKLLRYASELGTAFSLRLEGDGAALFHGADRVCAVTFPEYTDFYAQRTPSGLPFVGNAVLQGRDWVAFQCLWPCDYAAAGQPCEFCFSGADAQGRAERGKAQMAAVTAQDAAYIAHYAAAHAGASSVQITGGSMFSCAQEAERIRGYVQAIAAQPMPGEMLLYITPPEDMAILDEYFALGADRVACSIEVWDEALAREITPGKMRFATRERYLNALTHVAETHGAGRAFSNFIIGIEPIESLLAGAKALAERGIIPTASIWMPMGRPVRGSMRAPDIDFYRRAKEGFAELYVRYGLEPAGCCGLNVCMERDIWRYATGAQGACSA